MTRTYYESHETEHTLGPYTDERQSGERVCRMPACRRRTQYLTELSGLRSRDLRLKVNG